MSDLDQSKDPWSLLTVMLLGAALTLLLLVFVIGFAAKLGRNRQLRHHHPANGQVVTMRPAGYGDGKFTGISESKRSLFANEALDNVLIA